MKMTFENWHEDFSRFAEDLYPGRYSRDYVQRLAEMGEEVRRLAQEKNSVKWGMHLTPEAPRSSIRALEDHSRTLGEFQERFAFRFQIQPLPSPRGAQ